MGRLQSTLGLSAAQARGATDLLRWRLAAHTQEPWIVQGQVGGLDRKQGSIFHGDLENGPRACVFVRRGLGATKLTKLCTRDQAAVLLPAGAGGSEANLVVCSTYLPFDSAGPPPTRELRELVDYCKVNGLQLLIGCHANAHHIVWGSSNINRRGEALLEFLSTTDLEILNRGSSPTFVTSRRQEVLDITLGSKKVVQAIQDWRMDDEATLSDHRLITFKLTTESDLRASGTYRNPRVTCWPQYPESLKEELREHRV
ncbi:uncharacterized protein LOC114881543 [Osmia bicornis bicornis]|uniref:uncharacterized protein LOC114881543 n=1 Tax=Osmia bicornis bicornis TaxID=1437191 RepID=UPI0010F62F36|nr:uncharacterized protein LOC114881543 [Osmia bicornis bicornis]